MHRERERENTPEKGLKGKKKWKKKKSVSIE